MGTADFSFRPVSDKDVWPVAEAMRGDDAQELAASGLSKREGLLQSMALSTFAFTFFLCGEMAGMWGVWPAFPPTTALGTEPVVGVWLLTTTAVDRHPKAFLKASRAVLASLLDKYPALVNVVDARYERAIRWARHLGFEVLQAVPHGPLAMPFHPIRIRRTSWAP